MTTRIVGVFARREQAEQGIERLIGQGIPEREINVIMPAAKEGQQLSAAEAGGTAVGAGALAALGFASLAIIGIGPLIAAGPFAAALVTAANANRRHAEALAQLEEVLAHSGLSEAQARAYAQRLGEGNSIVAVDVADDQVDAIAEIFHQSGGAGLDYRPTDQL
ncbi:hypothetical protein F8S13_23585 [Chloroflexia bacterium SDU3-3]|nr:hypothetical protein F8S13_23585 [Chloroflexia bacterium SDU3-3]